MRVYTLLTQHIHMWRVTMPKKELRIKLANTLIEKFPLSSKPHVPIIWHLYSDHTKSHDDYYLVHLRQRMNMHKVMQKYEILRSTIRTLLHIINMYRMSLINSREFEKLKDSNSEQYYALKLQYLHPVITEYLTDIESNPMESYDYILLTVMFIYRLNLFSSDYTHSDTLSLLTHLYKEFGLATIPSRPLNCLNKQSDKHEQ